MHAPGRRARRWVSDGIKGASINQVCCPLQPLRVPNSAEYEVLWNTLLFSCLFRPALYLLRRSKRIG